MGRQDIVEKILESYNDVFTYIVNDLLFDGKDIIHADELEDQAPRATSKSDGRIREIERDVANAGQTATYAPPVSTMRIRQSPTRIYRCLSSVTMARNIERITVYDDHFTVEFKSGIEVDVEL